MDKILSFLFLTPLIVWSIFQPVLYINAAQVEQSLNSAIFEGTKKAALNGRYDESIYKEMRDYLVDVHNYKAEVIDIKGTESLTKRGDDLTVQVTVPKPVLSVMDIFNVNNHDPYVIKKTIRSEYIE